MTPPPSFSTHKTDPVIQEFGQLVPVQLGLAEETRFKSVAALNRLLAHATALCDLHKKSHRQVSGAWLHELRIVFDERADAQEKLTDGLAERVQTPGGVASALPRDIASENRLARAPSGVESSVNQLRKMVSAHAFVLNEARPLAKEAAVNGDDGTNDLIVSEVARRNELQSWMAGQHLVRVGSSA